MPRLMLDFGKFFTIQMLHIFLVKHDGCEHRAFLLSLLMLSCDDMPLVDFNKDGKLTRGFFLNIEPCRINARPLALAAAEKRQSG